MYGLRYLYDYLELQGQSKMRVCLGEAAQPAAHDLCDARLQQLYVCVKGSPVIQLAVKHLRRDQFVPMRNVNSVNYCGRVQKFC